MPTPIAWNRRPLPRNFLAPLPLTAVRPAGRLAERVREEKTLGIDHRLAQAYVLADSGMMDAVQNELEERLPDVSDKLSGDMQRALKGYYGATGDKQTLAFLLQYKKLLYTALKESSFADTALAANIGECLHTAIWLYNLTGREFLLELCRMLKAQSPDWMSTFHVFPQTKPVSDPPAGGTDAYYRVYGPSIAASLKTPALQSLFEGGYKNETAFDVGLEKLHKFHGAAHGLFNADPFLAGGNPSRGMDAMVVTEMIHTLQALLWARGDAAYGELLEDIAWNALPAARGTQAANQLCASHGDAAEGIAGYAAYLWMAAQDDGLAAIGYAPCEVRWRLGGVPVRIVVETEYPFGETVRICVRVKSPARFPLHLRIPSWCPEARLSIGGKGGALEELRVTPGTFERVEREWQNGDTLTLALPMAVTLVSGYHQSISVRRGPLLYALPVEAETQWRLALLPGRGFECKQENGMPVLYGYTAPVPSWERSGDSPAPLPISPRIGGNEVRAVRLIPYGQTSARITQFPSGASGDEES